MRIINIVLFIDACRSTGQKSGGLGIGEEKQQGVITFYSCSPSQVSYEIEEIQQGAFTHVLLNGLQIQGESNCATVERLYNYLCHQVRQLTQKHKNYPQTPYAAIEPATKLHYILLPKFANLTDIDVLKKDALNAEFVIKDFSLARQYWRRVIAAVGDDDDALNAIERLAKQNLTPQPPSLQGNGENSKPLSLQERGLERGSSEGEQGRKAAIAKTRELTVDLGQGLTLELVRVPAGKFTMGIPPQEREIALENGLKNGVDPENLQRWLDWSTPQHEIHLQEFLMGKYTVTNAQWRAVMKTNPSEKYDRKFQGDMQPVVGISWYEARAFCQKLSEQTKRAVRLPTEAEWEYACRAGTTTPFAFGNNITTNQVNYDGNNSYDDAPKGKYRECTVDVNSFSPNSWHLYQMHGNVWEWCLDRWHDSYSQKPKRLKSNGNEVWGETNVDEHDNLPHSVRGGSWCYDAFDCRSTNRCWYRAKDSDHDIGFRVVFGSSSPVLSTVRIDKRDFIERTSESPDSIPVM
ncbi:SUMF1/EgtB/PvdO family nonheme iron enzyme [Trichormus sp. NMC-1]|uniref:SUMF1/EgtB/PvdO family nonheme iron enzyme n=1 Tax=Trichormus sp. NMC-1 TaxID=1853259 RepID=UPI0022A8FDF6|nr:SUMF1/EgtB/PvdO family nonheme iron enzyme [Trichormus sp. NMC-1]